MQGYCSVLWLTTEKMAECQASLFTAYDPTILAGKQSMHKCIRADIKWLDVVVTGWQITITVGQVKVGCC